MSKINYLKAVFWDYPQFTDENYLWKQESIKIRESENFLSLLKSGCMN
jgi:hypothetical protein